ncbi:hypothetical protein WCLP8_3460003 [uncultured Gammaproteobacteria bacterium]
MTDFGGWFTPVSGQDLIRDIDTGDVDELRLSAVKAADVRAVRSPHARRAWPRTSWGRDRLRPGRDRGRVRKGSALACKGTILQSSMPIPVAC